MGMVPLKPGLTELVVVGRRVGRALEIAVLPGGAC